MRWIGCVGAVLIFCVVSPLFGQKRGFRPIIGTLPADSGFALGVGYDQEKFANGILDLRLEAIGSVKKYEQLDLRLAAPRLANERLFVEFHTRYRNYPEENFWGLGNDIGEGRRVNFRLEDWLVSGAGGFRPLPRLRVGATAGYLRVNTGPGKDNAFLSIEQLFTPDEVPALVNQPDYSLYGAFADYDSRDRPADPRAGGFYQARLTYYDDRNLQRHSFTRFDLELQQFLPVYQKRGTVAMRGLLNLTDAGVGQTVPFFMQPTAGGSNDLRGYHQYRFRDENRLIFNLEYRWEANPYVDLVAFGDAGRAFGLGDGVKLGNLRGSIGVGGRVKFRERVWLGVDVGYSHEGIRLWLRGSQMF